MEAAIRTFEDWEFRVLEQESGIGEEDEDREGKPKEEGREEEMEKEISRQQHVVKTAQVICVAHAQVFQRICTMAPWGLLLISESYAQCLSSLKLFLSTDLCWQMGT